MPFNLVVQGVANFHRLDRVLAKRKIARDPLSGVVDSSNKTFFTTYAPILTSGSLFVFTGATAVGGSADSDTGEVTLTNAPAVQPEATYTFIPYTLDQQLSFLIGGFDMMETQWSRCWKLVDGSGNAADETSAVINLVNSGGADPPVNGVVFSASRVQIGFYMACTRYSYLLTRLTGAAVDDFMWRETLRGMTVDKSRRPSNIAQAVEAARQAMLDAMAVAQDAYYPGGDHLGAFIGSPMTLEYAVDLEWQVGSKTDNNRAMRGSRTFLPLSGV